MDGHSEKLEAVETHRDKVSGAWVFRGTRVPVAALFENLRDGATVDQFLEWFPGVKREDVECLGSLWLPPKADQRLQKLMDCNSEGLLTDAECAELKSLVDLSERLSLFRADTIVGGFALADDSGAGLVSCVTKARTATGSALGTEWIAVVSVLLSAMIVTRLLCVYGFRLAATDARSE